MNIKSITENYLLDIIRRQQAITRTDLAVMTHIPFTTVTRMVDALLSRGLIKETGTTGSGRGRKQILLEVNGEKFKAIGVEINRRTIKAALVDLNGNVADYRVMETKEDWEESVSELSDSIASICRDQRIDPVELLGIGIGSPGPLNRETGTLISPIRFKHWEHVPIREKLRERFPLEVTLDFGASAAAMGEKWYGQGKDFKNIVYVNISGGIGCSIISNNQLLKSGNYDANGLGHMVIQMHGEPCECGNFGCLELYACENAIVQLYEKWIAEGQPSFLQKSLPQETSGYTFQEIASYAAKGDPVCAKVISEAASILGIGLSNFINIIHPELVILGGSIVEQSEQYYSIAVSVARNNMLNKENRRISFVKNKLSDRTIPIGAAALVFEGVFREVTDIFTI